MKRLVFIVLMLTLVGCGRKTPPVPPNAVIPQAISNLKYAADDTGVTLSWLYPARSIDGKSIDNIRVFYLHKAIIPEADYCEGCPVKYDQVIKIDARGTKSKRQLTYVDTDLQSGFHYVYMVKSDSGWRIQSDESNRINFSHFSTLMAPVDVNIEVGDHVLTLTWSPVTIRDDKSQASDVQYQVYRGSSRTRLRTRGDVVAEPVFVDKGVSNERTYYYNVRAVTVAGEFHTAGHASETVSGMALDMVAPTPPRNLKVVGLHQGIQLHWTPVTNSDLGGYRIYHHREGEKKWQRIGTAPKGAIGFRDSTDLEPGMHYFVVTSFDIGMRHNESEYSVKARYTAP